MPHRLPGWAKVMAVLMLIGLFGAVARNQESNSNHRSKWTAAEFDQLFKENNNSGRWGKNDQLGTINLITDAKRKQAASLVKLGITVSVAHDLMTEDSPDNPNGNSFKHTMGASFQTDTYTLSYHGFAVSHIDALCHFPYNGLLYNGVPKASNNNPNGCNTLSIEALKDGIVTRGILIDIPRLRGVPYLEPGTRIYQEEVEAWEKKIGVKVSPGDAIILHTGRWGRRAKVGAWNPRGNGAGFDVSMLPWIKAHDIALIGADSLADAMTTPTYVAYEEGQPSTPTAWNSTPMHAGLIAALGMPIIDNLDTEALAETAARLNRWEFMLVISPLRVPGGTGSPVNPVAIF